MSEHSKVVDNRGNNYIAPADSNLEPHNLETPNEPTMKIELETVSPQKAEEFLKKNTMNRKVIERNVDFIANQMLAGAWLDTGDTIKFATDGTLLDGQHRLKAIVKSKKTYKLFIARGLKKEAFEVIDTGKTRTASDVLSAHGMQNSQVLSSIGNIVLSIQKNGINNVIRPSGSLNNRFRRTHEEILNFCLDNPSLNEDAKYIKTGWRRFGYIRMSYLGSLYFLMVSKSSYKVADYFFDKYFEGDQLEKKDPIYILRSQLMQQNAKTKVNHREHLMWFITAWNHYRAQEKCEILRSNPELPLPKIN